MNSENHRSTESSVVKNNSRRRWSSAEKSDIVRRHLHDKTSQADLADQFGVAPGQISQWCKQALEGVESVFNGNSRRADKKHQKEIEQRDQKIHQLQEVVSELSTEVLQLKKSNGVI